MKKICSIFIIVFFGILLYFGAEINAKGILEHNQDKEVEFMEYAKDNRIHKFDNINKYFSLKSDMEEKADIIPKDEIFEIGKNIIITKEEVQLYKKFYELNDTGESSVNAEEYARERNALYVEAIKNGFTVTDNDIENYLVELKEQLKSCLSEEEYNDLCSAYGGEEQYWEFQHEVYQVNLPIQNYIKNIESQYKEKNEKKYTIYKLEEMWDTEFEKIKKNLVKEQNFS